MDRDTYVDGAFLLQELFDRGASGPIYKAKLSKSLYSLQSRTRVVVKFYHDAVLERPNQIERICREYETGRRISDPDLVRAFDTKRVEFESRKRPVFVMEYFKGACLDRYLKVRIKGGRLQLLSSTATLKDLASLRKKWGTGASPIRVFPRAPGASLELSCHLELDEESWSLLRQWLLEQLVEEERHG